MPTVPALARSLHQRFTLRIPVNLDLILATEGLEVVEYPFAGELKESIYNGVIGLRPGLSRAEQRELMAHALAHHLSHEGNHLRLDNINPLLRPKQEHQANLFAQYLLIPTQPLSELLRKRYSLEGIAEAFDVSVPFLTGFLDALDTSTRRAL